MKKTCKFCGEKIVKAGFIEIMDILDASEGRRLSGLKKSENICLECKTEILFAQLIKNA